MFRSPKRDSERLKTGQRRRRSRCRAFRSFFYSSFSSFILITTYTYNVGTTKTRRDKDQYWAAPVFPMNSTGRPVEYSARFGYMAAFVENCSFVVGERRTKYSIGKFLLRRSFNVDASTRLRPSNRTKRRSSLLVVHYFRRTTTTSTDRERRRTSEKSQNEISLYKTIFYRLQRNFPPPLTFHFRPVSVR